MAILRRLNERRQITIPASLIRDAGLPEGGLYSVQVEEGRIVLEPKELKDRELEKEDWKALEALVAEQVRKGHFTEYPSPRAAKRHLKRIRR